MFSVPFGEGDGGSVKDGEASRLFEMGESRKCGANFPVVDVSAYSGQITACDAHTTEAHAHAYDLRRSYAKAEVRVCRRDADRPS